MRICCHPDGEFVIASPHLFEVKLVFYLLPEEIVAQLYYFGRLDHSKSYFQELCYPSKNYIFGTRFDGSYGVYLHTVQPH